jgi:hypothetical protein
MSLPLRLPAAALLLSLVLPATPLATAQLRPPDAPPCTAPASTLRARICDDAELRAADARLRGLEPALATTTARPATLAQRARAWQAMLEAGEAAESGHAARPFDRDGLRDAYALRIATLEEALRQDRALRRLEPPRGQGGGSAGTTISRPTTLERSCLGEVLRHCRVTATGMAISEDRRTRILWQTQYGAIEAEGVRGGIVLLAEQRGGWQLLSWSFEGQGYDAPRLVAQDGGLLLHVRSLGEGTAHADLLYRQGPTGWAEIETESWWEALPRRLPPGLGIRQAVSYDVEQMTAAARLWREDDAECCPTGGGAMLGFRIEDRRLVLADIGLNAAARAAQPRADTCPAERATYRLDAPADWIAELRREGPPASAASDLLLRLHSGGSARDYWFRFAAAQGYGGLSLWPVAAPGPETAEDGVRDLEPEDTLRIDIHPITDTLSVLPDPPRSGMPAPRRLFMPALGHALHYGALPQQADASPSPREHMPPGFWILLSCR